jgi:hypothetical protein
MSCGTHITLAAICFVFVGCSRQTEPPLASGDTLLLVTLNKDTNEVFSLTMKENETFCSHVMSDRKIAFTIEGKEHKSIEALLRDSSMNTLDPTSTTSAPASIIVLRNSEATLSHPLNDSPLTYFCYNFFKESSVRERFRAAFLSKGSTIANLIRLGER